MIGRLSSFGLDLGPTVLRVAEIRRGAGGRLFVRSLDRLEVRTDPSRSGPEAREDAVRRALALFTVNHLVRARDVVVAAIPGAETDNRVVSLPPVPPKRRFELARAEAVTLRASPAEGARHAFASLPQVSVNETRVLVAAHPASAIEEAAASLTSTEIRPDGIVPAPIALANLLAYDLKDVEDALFVNLGTDATDVVCAPGDSIWFRSIPLGTREIARALAARPGSDAKAAEAARISLTRGEPVAETDDAVRAFLDRAIGDIRKALDFHRRRIGAFVPARVQIAGEGARLPGAAAQFAEAFHARVEPLLRLNRLRISREAYASSELRDLPAFAVALGAALQGLEPVPFPLSFVEPDAHRAAARSAPGLAAAAALVLAGAGAGDLLASRASDRAEAVWFRANAAARSVEEARERSDRARAIEEVQLRVDAAATRAATRDLWESGPALALSALGEIAPISSCEFRPSGAELELEFVLVAPAGDAAGADALASRVEEALRTRLDAERVEVRLVDAETPAPGDGTSGRLLRGSAAFGQTR